MRIDYKRLYSSGDFGSNEGESGFDGSIAELVAKVAKQVGCPSVLDIGLSGRALVDALEALDIPAVSIDPFREPVPGSLTFDLTSVDSHDLEELSEKVHQRLDTNSWQTTCLNLLERVHRQDLPAALWNLRELSTEWLLVSVCTRPSSRDNLYHATVAPRRTWRRLFDSLGFERVEMPTVDNLPPHKASISEMQSSVNRWRRIDPFRDTQEPDPYFMCHRKCKLSVSKLEFETQARQILGLTACEHSHTLMLDPRTHITFLIGHYQDFHHYRPYWDRLDRDSVSIVLRGGALRGMDEPRYQAVVAYLQARALPYQEVESVDQVRWNTTPGTRNALVVATESTAIEIHMLNAAFVLAARAAEYRTFQLQHGIWPHADFSEPISFASEHVLTWSDEFKNGFDSQLKGDSQARGITKGIKFTIAGCAKFDEYAREAQFSPSDLLGDWAEAYGQMVLVATNLHWPSNQRGEEVIPAILQLAYQRPDTLFLLKLHPVHDPKNDLIDILPSNTQLLDEFACLFGDLSTPRLVLASAAVLTTPSTIALEAALADRPFATIDTGNHNRYFGTESVPLAEIGKKLDEMLATETRTIAIARHEQFSKEYFDQSFLGNGLERVLVTIESELESPPPSDIHENPALWMATTFAASVTNHYVPEGRSRLFELSRQLESGRREQERLEALWQVANRETEELHSILQALRRHTPHQGKLSFVLKRMVQDLLSSGSSLVSLLGFTDRKYPPT